MTEIKQKIETQTKTKNGTLGRQTSSIFDAPYVTILTPSERNQNKPNVKTQTQNEINITDTKIAQILSEIIGAFKIVEKCFDKRSSFDFLFFETHRESNRFFRSVLQIFKKNTNSMQELKYLIKRLRDQTKTTAPDINDFLYYIQKFILSGYITFKDGELIHILPRISLDDSLSQWTKIVENSKIKNYDGLILKNGEIYLALFEHELLAYWLTINNIDVSSCIRLHQSFNDDNKLFISSLAPYPYHADSQDYLELELSYEQAYSLYQMFKKLGKGKPYYKGCDFESLIANYSENLGTHVIDGHRNLLHNLELLHQIADKDFDDVKIYNELTKKFKEYRLNLANIIKN